MENRSQSWVKQGIGSRKRSEVIPSDDGVPVTDAYAPFEFPLAGL
jgi:hypothetical protein